MLLSRRELLVAAGAGAITIGSSRSGAAPTPTPAKAVAAVVTVYRPNSHADVLVTKILQGWRHDGGLGPNLRLASLYVDQFPEDDLARDLAKRHAIPLVDSISDALTLGTQQVVVDGVLSIGEHGDYPYNEFGQHLYPRRRFFEQICATCERYQHPVPVFNDKHLGPVWTDAKWMYDRARALRMPLMAGSSLPVSYRVPDQNLPWQATVTRALAVGYSGLDVYGIHTLELLQSVLERRRGGETGVRAVQALPVEKLPELIEQGILPLDLLTLGLQSSGTHLDAVRQGPRADTAIFLLHYVDGLTVPVLMLAGMATGTSVVCQSEAGDPLVVRAEERSEPRYPHFALLLKGIEQMMHTGQPAYPVERTLLTAGCLDRLLRSHAQGGTLLASPELEIAYTPVDYPYGAHLDLSRTW